MRASRLAALGLAAALLLSGCGSDEAKTFSGKALDNPYTVPTTELVDTDGKPFSLADDTDKPLTLVFFGYVNCVDICPAVLNHLASAMTRLDDSDRDKVDVVLVTSDPDTDTPASLRTYLDRFDESFIGLDGDFATIKAVGRALAVGIDDRDPGGHTTQVMGVDSDDMSPVYWSADTSPAQFADDIHTLLEDT
ncbi:SCO family protein [Nocardioides sp.]|uniref:SCO family protein n=1 Tax=Nocardioides sp. TaxID=35761 RepID=UPI0027198BDB|nr:SCO family protein [Nocardioides sp.]MDO9455103.1 SCO family protein [Nocardioides sp.]